MSNGSEELAKRLEESKGTFATTLRNRDIEQAAALLRQQSQEVESLREALDVFGDHKPSCPSADARGPCVCGWSGVYDRLVHNAAALEGDR